MAPELPGPRVEAHKRGVGGAAGEAVGAGICGCERRALASAGELAGACVRQPSSGKARSLARQDIPYSDNCGALRLTAAAPRDPHGRARMMQQIDALLRELTDVETGLPVVTSTPILLRAPGPTRGVASRCPDTLP
jgi:hypothetical protein